MAPPPDISSEPAADLPFLAGALSKTGRCSPSAATGAAARKSSTDEFDFCASIDYEKHHLGATDNKRYSAPTGIISTGSSSSAIVYRALLEDQTTLR
jgi:hypothetical protein